MTILTTVFTLFLAGAGQAAAQDELSQDFRGRAFDTHFFKLEGPNASELVRTENEGLRIILAATKNTQQPIGIVLRPWVRGDFTLTIDYALLHADKPTSGYGAGLGVYVMFNSAVQDAVNVGIARRTDDNLTYSITHKIDDGKGGRKNQTQHGVPASSQALSGKMRFVRAGPHLSISVSEANSTAYREIGNFEIGTDALKKLRIAADQGQSECLVDLRVISLTVQADGIGPQKKGASPPPGSAVGYGWILAGALVLVAFFFIVRLFLAKRKRS